MTRALENILSNAIKYSPENSEVLLACKLKGHKLQISVTDNGIGVKQTEQRAIFERFYQGEHNETYPGKGLGLSIARSIVKGHAGQIYVESKPNVKTTFTIEIPVSSVDKASKINSG